MYTLSTGIENPIEQSLVSKKLVRIQELASHTSDYENIYLIDGDNIWLRADLEFDEFML